MKASNSSEGVSSGRETLSLISDISCSVSGVGFEELKRLGQFTQLSLTEIGLISHPILKDLDISKRLNHNIDLYFPDKNYIEIYTALLKVAQSVFNSSSVIQPFLSSTIGQINGIKINAVSIEDIKNLRENEEVFKVWRDFTQEILTELYKTESLYSDKGQEFLHIAKLKFKDVDANIKSKLHKSPVLKDLTNTFEQSIIGVSVGAVAGVMSGLNPANSMITGGLAPWIKLIVSYIRTVNPMNENISLNNHFLVYDLK